MFANVCIDNENGQGGSSGLLGGDGNGDLDAGSGGSPFGSGGHAGGIVSAGGGGFYIDGFGIFCDGINGEGKRGYDFSGIPTGGAGGSSETCVFGDLFKSGGFGFGGGGAGRGAGGGGGGVTGGGGGGTTGRGGGGGSYVDPAAFDDTITAGGNNIVAQHGVVLTTCSLSPIALCKNISIDLDETGHAILETSQIDNGSYDPDGGPITMALSSVNFNCDSVGIRTVTLTVYNEELSSSECTAQVTVRDITPPKIFCHDPINTSITDLSLCGAIVPYNIDCCDCNSCTILQLEGLPNGALFPVGTTYNSFVAIDASGNRSDTCSFSVTVLDPFTPTAICYSFINLLPDEFGNYKPDPALINAGSYDNCGIGSLTVSPAIIPCVHDNLKQMVLLIVEDIYGNQNTCTSEITLLSDDDCDGVGNTCDQCPGGDDQVDNNHDSLPDCANFPGMENLPDAWKCGNDKKVLMCHVESLDPFVATSLCVSPSAVAAHLAHGDYLGPCSSPKDACFATEGLKSLDPFFYPSGYHSGFSHQNNTSISLYPNPNPGAFTLHWDKLGTDGITSTTIAVYSVLGGKVWEKKIPVKDQQSLQINLDKHLAPAGIYYLQIMKHDQIKVIKFIVRDN